MRSPVSIRLLGLVNGQPSPYDGQWLVHYDPTRAGVDPDGAPTTAHIVCSPDPDRARRFDNPTDACDYWRQTSGRPWPADRPLTAYTVAIEEAPAD